MAPTCVNETDESSFVVNKWPAYNIKVISVSGKMRSEGKISPDLPKNTAIFSDLRSFHGDQTFCATYLTVKVYEGFLYNFDCPKNQSSDSSTRHQSE